MTRLYLTVGAVLLAAVSIGLILGEPLSSDWGSSPKQFEAKAFESSGSLILEWDPRSPLVKTATGGSLEYVDGGTPHRDQVDARVLRQGALEYRKRSNDVLLRLLLLNGKEVIGHASVRLTGSPATPAPNAAR